jgi:hypothetical protein
MFHLVKNTMNRIYCSHFHPEDVRDSWLLVSGDTNMGSWVPLSLPATCPVYKNSSDQLINTGFD